MSKNNKQENGQTLESILFNCRNALRGAGGTEKNRDAVIGLVFIKFAGDKFEKRRKELKKEYGDIPAFLEKKSFYLAKNVFYLQEHCRWSYIVKEANSNDIAVKLDKIISFLNNIDEEDPSFNLFINNMYEEVIQMDNKNKLHKIL